jgi:hypothetical protein
MLETWRYRGQTLDRAQLTFLREFIAAHPDSSRWKLSRQLCEALGWKQANGALRDVVCRGLLLLLDRAGEIVLPPVRRHIPGQCRNARLRPELFLVDTTPLVIPLARYAGRDRDATRAAHCRRAAVQQPDRAVSLSWLRTAGRFCDILLYLTNYLKTLIADQYKIEFAGGEDDS